MKNKWNKRLHTPSLYLDSEAREERHSYMYLLRHRCTGFLERGCGREADKARGVAECLIRLRDHIRVQEIP